MSSGPVDSAVGAASNLMQRAERQPSSRQYLVYLGDAEWQDLAPACRATLEPRDAFPKLDDMKVCRAIGQNPVS